MIQAAYGPGSRSRTRRLLRARIAIATPIGIRSDVYFDENANPTARPLTHHQPSDAREPGGDWTARTTPYTPNDTVARRGASGVASTRPAAASDIQVMISAARSAERSPASRSAMPAVATAATRPATTG